MAQLTMLDFWAPWCEPCQRLAPILEDVIRIANENREGVVELQKINIDEDDTTAGRYGIRGIPTVIFLKNNIVVARVVGVKPARTYLELIEENL